MAKRKKIGEKTIDAIKENLNEGPMEKVQINDQRYSLNDGPNSKD